MRLGLAIVALVASGCGGDDGSLESGATDDFIDMDTPPGNCSAGPMADPCPTPGTTGAPEGGPCASSAGCESGNACVAPFIDGEVGEFTCTSQCIALLDESAWCLDASACCDAEAVCNTRGLCVVPAGGLDESGSGSTTDTGSSSSDSSSSDSSSGSDTGATTATTGMR